MGKRNDIASFCIESQSTHLFFKEKLFTCFDELGLDKELYQKRVGEISGWSAPAHYDSRCSHAGKPLIIVDEPTSALDAGSTDKVLAFFRNQAEKGTAILAVSHDRTFAYGCNQLITL